MKQIVQYVDQAIEVTLDTRVVGETVEVGQVVRAVPNSGGKEYVRLQFNDGRSYRFDGKWMPETSADVAVERRWVPE